MPSNFVNDLASLLNTQGAVALLGGSGSPASNAAPAASTSPDAMKNAQAVEAASRANYITPFLIGGGLIVAAVVLVRLVRK